MQEGSEEVSQTAHPFTEQVYTCIHSSPAICNPSMMENCVLHAIVALIYERLQHVSFLAAIAARSVQWLKVRVHDTVGCLVREQYVTSILLHFQSSSLQLSPQQPVSFGLPPVDQNSCRFQSKPPPHLRCNPLFTASCQYSDYHSSVLRQTKFPRKLPEGLSPFGGCPPDLVGMMTPLSFFQAHLS